MARLAGETALVTGASSGIGLGIARALVGAGARIAIVDVDARALAATAVELAAAGREVTALRRDPHGDLATTAARAEERTGPLSIVCDVAATKDSPADKPFRLCRWTREDGAGPLTLVATPVSALAAMALLVPGAMPTRIRHTAGVSASGVLGTAELVRRASADELGRLLVDQLVEQLVEQRSVITTAREWETGAPTRTAGGYLVSA